MTQSVVVKPVTSKRVAPKSGALDSSALNSVARKKRAAALVNANAESRPARSLARITDAGEPFPVRAARAARCAAHQAPAVAEALQRLVALLEPEQWPPRVDVDGFLRCLLAAANERSEWFVGDLLRVPQKVADDMLMCLDAKRRRSLGDTWGGMAPYQVARSVLQGVSSPTIAASIVQATAEAAIWRLARVVQSDDRWRCFAGDQALARLFLLTMAAPHHTGWCCADLLGVGRSVADDMLSCLDAFRRDPSFVQRLALRVASELGTDALMPRGSGLISAALMSPGVKERSIDDGKARASVHLGRSLA